MTDFSYKDLEIVYEDNHVVVVVKPQNVPSCPDETGDLDMQTAIKQYLVEKYDKPGDAYVGLVHRLDRPTGGVMVYAKTSKAAARLCDAIKSGEVEKKYLAVVAGSPKEKCVNGLTHYLIKNPQKNVVMVVPMATEGAKRATLDYRTLAESNGMSLLSVRLHTGRAHQIRVQMATIGVPLFGDQKYGQGKSPVGYNLALWATELKFVHPTTKETLVFRVYPPVHDVPWKFFDVSRYLSIRIKSIYE
ncbi:MAG: RNA pseudouridine synthase [Clostridia bacterium]|nr:RNA pseudouridine synthase [Clostridia bacterium]